MADAISVKTEIDKLPQEELQKLAGLLLQSHPQAASGRIPIETYRLVYKEHGDQIRHFSTVRSAATTFLLTVSLAALSAYFNKTQTHPFLVIAGFFLLLAAVVVCLVFSFRTEKAVLRYKYYWSFLSGSEAPQDRVSVHNPSSGAIVNRMPLLLVVAVLVIVMAFAAQDSLGSFLRSSNEPIRQIEELPTAESAR